jgi:UDP-GlcNAc:undecaprenyl-phosphate GlcNAc-1-phosphate transferase
MGDSGSLFLGYTLACSALLGASNTKTPTLIAILVPLVALGLPIMDMLFAIARRFLERRSIFAADRGHIHHRLLDVGLTHRRAVWTLYGLSFAFTATALTIHIGRSWQIGGALVVLALALVAVVRFVGYFNAALAARQAAERDGLTERLRRAVPITLVRIASEGSAHELPRLLESFAAENGLLSVSVQSPESPGRAAQSWRWVASEGEDALRDAAAVCFAIVDARSVASELKFQWDSPTTTTTPQCEILLQLVADACESLLNRSSVVEVVPERAPVNEKEQVMVPTSSGRVRTSGNNDHGIDSGAHQLVVMK